MEPERERKLTLAEEVARGQLKADVYRVAIVAVAALVSLVLILT